MEVDPAEGNKDTQRGEMEGEVVALELNPQRTFEVARHALVGRLMTDKALNRKTVRSMIEKSWGNPKGLHIVDLNTNTYLFNFSEPQTPQRIMEEAPWNIMGCLLSLHRWLQRYLSMK